MVGKGVLLKTLSSNFGYRMYLRFDAKRNLFFLWNVTYVMRKILFQDVKLNYMNFDVDVLENVVFTYHDHEIVVFHRKLSQYN